MIKPKQIILITAILFSIPRVSAKTEWSGGQVGNLGSAHLSLLSPGDIKVLLEQTKITLKNGYADVSIQYVFRNDGAEQTGVTCGFPFVIYSNGYKNKGRYISGIHNYSISVNDKKIHYKYSRGNKITWLRAAKSRYKPRIRYGWYKSRLHFDKNEIKRVSVKYRSCYNYSVNRIASDTIYTSERFRYFLYTGATWNGPVKTGRIIIDASNVDADSIAVSPKGRFIQKGKRFVWDYFDRIPTVADTVAVNLNNKNRSLVTSVDKRPVLYWQFGSRVYRSLYADKIGASSQFNTTSYVPEKVQDFNKRTAWIEGKDDNGAGEFIELKFKNGVSVDIIGIIPGIMRNKRSFYANNRIKTLSVMINGIHYKKMILKDRYFSYSEDQYQLYDLIDVSAYKKKIFSIRMVVADIYSGTGLDNTGISEIVLLEKVTKIPDHLIK